MAVILFEMLLKCFDGNEVTTGFSLDENAVYEYFVSLPIFSNETM